MADGTLLGDARFRVRPDLTGFKGEANRSILPVFKGLAVAAAGVFATVKVGSFLKGSVSEASDLNETLNKTRVIFGDNADAVIAWSRNSAKSMGLSQNATLSYASSLDDMFLQIGIGAKESQKLSQSTVELASDLGSFSNLETPDVLERISAAYRGEYDSLQALVPTITAATVERKAMDQTGKESAKTLTAQDKALAVNAIITENSTRAMGDFNKTSRDVANATKIAGAGFDNFKATVGTAFLPVVGAAINLFNDQLLPGMQAAAEKYAPRAAAGLLAVSKGVGGLASVLFRGEFQGREATFGIDEDSPVIGALLTIRNAIGAVWYLLFKGEYGGRAATFGLEEDAPFVATLLNLHYGIEGIYSLLFKGEYAGRQATFGLEEDARWVNVLLSLHDGIGGIFSLLFKGEYAGRQATFGLEEDAAFVGVLISLHDGILGVFDILFKGEYAGKEATFGLEEDSTAVGVLFAIREGADALWRSFRDLDAAPIKNFLSGLELGDGVGADLESLGESFITLRPAFSAFADGLPDLGDVLHIVAGGVAFLADHVDTLIALMPFIIAAFLAWKIAQQAQVAIAITQIPLQAARTVAMLAEAGATYALASALLQINGMQRANILTRIADTIVSNVRTAALWAQTAALWAASLATRAWALGQTVLNAVLSANPLGIIIVGIGLLVAAFILAYKHSDSFRAIVDSLWSSIKTGAKAVVDWFVGAFLPGIMAAWDGVAAGGTWLWEEVLSPVFSFIKAGVMLLVEGIKLYIDLWIAYFRLIAAIAMWLWENALGPVFRWIGEGFGLLVDAIKSYWENTLKPTFNFIGAVASALWESTLKPVFRAIMEGFGAALNGMKWVWENVLSPVFNALLEGVGRVKDGFAVAIDGIKAAWDRLKGIALAPVKFVAETVLENGLFAAFNNVAKFFDAKDGKGKALEVHVPSGVKTALGFADGGYTGDGHKLEPAGIVHRGEYVATKEETSRIGAGNIRQFLKTAGRTTRGYYEGGLVGFGRMLERAGATVGENPAFGTGRVGRHSKNSLHYSGRAIDVNYDGKRQSEKSFLAPFGRAAQAAGFGVFFNVPGLPHLAGHDNHLHIDDRYGTGKPGESGDMGKGGILGGIGSLLSGVFDVATDPLGYLKDKLGDKLSKVGGGTFGSLAGGAVSKLLPLAVDKIKSFLPSLGGGSQDYEGAPFNGAAVGGKGVQRWAPMVLQALERVGQPASLLQTVLRRMNQESGGNPRAINLWDSNAKKGIPSKGLLQTIDPTFQRWRDKSLANDVYEPFANIVASLRYTMGTYGTIAKGYNRAGGYMRGTTAASPGLHWVGENGPELLQFRGGERVHNTDDSRQIAAGASTPPINITFQSTGDPRRDAEDVTHYLRHAHRGGVLARR